MEKATNGIVNGIITYLLCGTSFVGLLYIAHAAGKI
ncbi:hypothetical protein UFOVP591_34 [uncultured Caudovirales phage]|jgi:hypothetical protein|uniref:Uncharacterized protein n=1 Tax=uncultured Caudovirales phage TaxID=2100421 RepID=A0A6J5N0W2_9CAUD|nr:hypothetical protein UFOVP591_34 [uncultured Caudovirales phage]